MEEEKKTEELSPFKRLANLLNIPLEDINESEFSTIQNKMVEFLENDETQLLAHNYIDYHTHQFLKTLDYKDQLAVMLELAQHQSFSLPILFGMILGWFLHRREDNPSGWWVTK